MTTAKFYPARTGEKQSCLLSSDPDDSVRRPQGPSLNGEKSKSQRPGKKLTLDNETLSTKSMISRTYLKLRTGMHGNNLDESFKHMFLALFVFQNNRLNMLIIKTVLSQTNVFFRASSSVSKKAAFSWKIKKQIER